MCRYLEKYVGLQRNLWKNAHFLLRCTGYFLFVSQIHSLPFPKQLWTQSLLFTSCIYSPQSPLVSGWLGKWEFPATDEEEGGMWGPGIVPCLCSYQWQWLQVGATPLLKMTPPVGASLRPFSLFYHLYFLPFKTRGLSSITTSVRHLLLVFLNPAHTFKVSCS